MYRLLMLMSVVSTYLLAGCETASYPFDVVQSPPSASQSETLTKVELEAAGGWWGNYTGAETAYRIDVAGCEGHVGNVIIYDSSDLATTQNCGTLNSIGEDVRFTLDLTKCSGIPPEARVKVTDCSVNSGYFRSLLLSMYPTPDAYSASDVYGDFSLHVTLPSRSTLLVSGPYSHCGGGEPCVITSIVNVDSEIP